MDRFFNWSVNSDSRIGEKRRGRNRRRYVNFENGSHFIYSLNLNNPELTVFIAFKMTDISSKNQEFVDNTNGKFNAKHITFYRTFGGLGLVISKAHGGTYVAIANDSSSLIPNPDMKFPSSKSDCTDLNKWHVISVTWSNKRENLSNCWSDGEKLISFTIGMLKVLIILLFWRSWYNVWFEKNTLNRLYS